LQDLQTGKELDRLIPAPDPEGIKGPYGGVHWPLFGVSTDGRTAASSIQTQKGNLIHIWDLTTGRAVMSRTDTSGGSFPMFSPDGGILASKISGNLEIGLEDVATGKKFAPLTVGLISNAAFSPDSRTLFSITRREFGQRDGVNFVGYICRLWELAAAEERLSVIYSEPAEAPAFRFAQKMAFSPDGRSIATSFPDGTIRLLDTATLKERLRRSYDSRVDALALHRTVGSWLRGTPIAPSSFGISRRNCPSPRQPLKPRLKNWRLGGQISPEQPRRRLTPPYGAWLRSRGKPWRSCATGCIRPGPCRQTGCSSW
jgi:WD40 repeat protein